MPEIKDEIKKRPNKQALLRDLEDIRDSLSEDDIPILTDSIIDDEDDSSDDDYQDDEDESDDAPVTAFNEKHIFEDFDQFEDEDEDDEQEHDIQAYVDEDLGEVSDEEILRAAYRQTANPLNEQGKKRAGSILEGQQSLFDDIHQTGIREGLGSGLDKRESALPQAMGENPFLPKHIRDRLTQGKNSFLEEIALVNESLKRAPSRPADNKPEIRAPQKPLYTGRDPQKADYQKVVDELVKEFLPQLESALRKRLTQILSEKEK